MRVTSLFPAATEILFAIGAGDEVVGVSHACDYPAVAGELQIVTRARYEPVGLSSAEIYRRKVEAADKYGSLYRLDESAMWACKPDVLITQGPIEFSLLSIQGVRAIAEGLHPRPELLVLYPKHLDEVLDDHVRVGFGVRHLAEATSLVEGLRERIQAVEQAVSGAKRRTVAFIQWMDPPYAGGFWIPQLIDLVGGMDVFGVAALAPSRIHWPDLRKADPDVLVLACEDMSIERAESETRLMTERPGWWELTARRKERVYIGDGPVFTRGGPRLIDGLEALAWALHPDRFPPPPAHVLRALGD